MTTANIKITKVLLGRGNTAISANYTGVMGEVTMDTTLKTLRVHDGVVVGGTRLATYSELANVSVGNIDLSGYATTAQITAANANAGVQATAINSINANLGAFQTYANATFGVGTYSNTNVAAYLSSQNITSANIGAFQMYANANAASQASAIASLQSNAAIQASLIDGLTGNAATQGGALSDLVANAAAQSAELTTLLSNASAQATELNTLLGNASAQATQIDLINANIANVAPSLTNGVYQLKLQSNGNVTVPSGVHFIVPENGNIALRSTGATGNTHVEWHDDATGDRATVRYSATGVEVYTTSAGVQRSWLFHPDGSTHFPQYTFPLGAGAPDSYLKSDGVGGLNWYSTFGNLIPSANVTYSLGSEQYQWKDLWVSNNTIYIGNTPIRVDNGTLLINGQPTYSNANVSTYLTRGNVTIGNVTIKDNYDQQWQFRDGALIWPAGDGTPTGPYIEGSSLMTVYPNNDGEFRIQTYSTTAVGSRQWKFNSEGNLIVPDDATIHSDLDLRLYAEEGNIALGNQNGTWMFNADGTTNFPNDRLEVAQGNTFTIGTTTAGTDDNEIQVNSKTIDIIASNINAYSWSELFLDNTNILTPVAQIRVNATGGTEKVWTFDGNGRFTAPGDVYGQYFTVRGGGFSGDEIGSLGYGGDIIELYGTNGVRISTVGEGGPLWQFGTDGNLTLPGSIVANATIIIDNRDSGDIADIVINSADDITVQAKNRTEPGPTEGGDLNLYAGTGGVDDNTVGAGPGGDLQIYAGDGGAGNVNTGAFGGAISIVAGNGGAGSAGARAGGGGGVNITAGSAGSDNGAGGYNGGGVFITAGDSSDANLDRGSIVLTAGEGGDETSGGGYVQIIIPSVGTNPGGEWVFNNTGLTFEPPPNGEIFNPSTGNLTLGTVGNTIIRTIGGATYDWVFDPTGNLTAPGNITANYFVGDGSQLTNLPTTYGDADVENLLQTLSTEIYSTANVQAGYFIGDGGLLTNVTTAYGNTEVAAYLANYDGIINFTASPATINTGEITAANVSSTNGFFWGNGTPYSTGGGGTTYTNANVTSHLLTFINANFDTLLANNFTSGNAFISGAGGIGYTRANAVSRIGNVYSNYGNFLNLSSGNVFLSGAGGVGYTAANAVSRIGNVYSTYGNFTNFSTANAILTGGYINTMTNVVATLGSFTNFESGNVLITGGYISSLANATVSGNVTAGNLIGYGSGTSITAGAYTSTFDTAGMVTVPDLTVTGTASIPNITVSGNVNITGGEWQEYTPVWTSADGNAAIGNGFVEGRYKQIGKVVHVYIMVGFGSSTTFGSGEYKVSLPVAGRSVGQAMLSLVMHDVGTRLYNSLAHNIYSTYGTNVSSVTLFWDTGVVTHSAPFTWTDGDYFVITGTYEAGS